MVSELSIIFLIAETLKRARSQIIQAEPPDLQKIFFFPFCCISVYFQPWQQKFAVCEQNHKIKIIPIQVYYIGTMYYIQHQ